MSMTVLHHGTVVAAKLVGTTQLACCQVRLAHDRNFSDVIYLDPATHTKIEEVGSANFFGITTNNEFRRHWAPLFCHRSLLSLFYLAEHRLGMTPIEGDVFINDLVAS